MNTLIEQILQEVIEKFDRPCMVSSQEIYQKVKEIWLKKGYRGVDITPNRMGRILKKMNFEPYHTAEFRGWLIK